MDAQIGRVLQALDANGLTENTIVIFTSDNGGERFADTWPFTGRKTELLEGGLRIPAIDLVARPDSAKAETSDQVAITMDWMPTLLAAAGAAPDPALPARRHQPAAGAHGQAPRRSRASCSGATRRTRSGRVRDGDYKFLKILDNTFLFNVVEDPMERANLKERQKEIYDRLVAEWLAWNATMLPEVDESFTELYTGAQLGDHYGAQKPSGAPDPAVPLDTAPQSR